MTDVEIDLGAAGDLAAHPMPAGRPTRAHRADVVHYPPAGASAIVGRIGFDPARDAWHAVHEPAGAPRPTPMREPGGSIAYFAEPEEALRAIAAAAFGVR